MKTLLEMLAEIIGVSFGVAVVYSMFFAIIALLEKAIGAEIVVGILGALIAIFASIGFIGSFIFYTESFKEWRELKKAPKKT